MGNWFVSPLPPSSSSLSLFAADWGRRRMRNAAREKSSSLLLSSNRGGKSSKLKDGHWNENIIWGGQSWIWLSLWHVKWRVACRSFQWPWLVWNGEIDRCGSVSPAAQREWEREEGINWIPWETLTEPQRAEWVEVGKILFEFAPQWTFIIHEKH